MESGTSSVAAPTMNLGTVNGSTGIRVYSFDLFDTLIARRLTTPTCVWRELEPDLRRLGVPEAVIASFPELRRAASGSCKRALKREEITIEQIYGEFAKLNAIPAELVPELVEAEVLAECRHMVGIRENLTRVHDLVDRGHRVIIISDMYLRYVDVERILSGIDDRLLSRCKLYLSSDHGCLKRSGKLFRVVCEAESVTPEQVLHFGDDEVTDQQVPRGLGVATQPYAVEPLNSWEHRLKKVPGKDGSRLAGMSRAARLSGMSDQEWVGYAVAGPILLGFVTWLLDRARQDGTEHLHFVSRDGEILLKIANELNREGSPKCSYLYGSRQAFNLASVHRFGTRELEWLLARAVGLTAGRIAKRGGIPPELLVSVARERGVTIDSDTILKEADFRGIKELFANSGELHAAVQKAAEVERSRLVAYLRQVGITDGGRIGYVDLGWMGNVQDALFHILVHEDIRVRLRGYYVGLIRHTSREGPANFKSGWYGRPGDGLAATRRIARLTRFLEILCSATHGSVVGYDADEQGVVHPRLDLQGDILRGWGVETLQQGILRFVRDYSCAFGAMDPVSGLMCTNFLIEDTYIPTPAIAEVIGSCPFTEGQEGGNVREFAPRMSTAEAWRLAFARKKTRNDKSLWIQGTLARSDEKVRRLWTLGEQRSIAAWKTTAAQASRQTLAALSRLKTYALSALRGRKTGK